MTIPQMAALAKDHWKAVLPELYQTLQENGKLEREAEASAELTMKEMETLMKGGMSEAEAWQASRNLFIFSPERELRDLLYYHQEQQAA